MSDSTEMVAKVNELLETLRSLGYTSVEIGGYLHGVVARLAAQMCMSKEEFLGHSDVVYSHALNHLDKVKN